MRNLCLLLLSVLISTPTLANRSVAKLNAYRDKLTSVVLQPSMLRWARGESLIQVQDKELQDTLAEMKVSSVVEFEQTLTDYASILAKLFGQEKQITRPELLALAIIGGYPSLERGLAHILMNRTSLTDVDKRATIAGKMLTLMEISYLPHKKWVVLPHAIDYLGLEQLILRGDGSLRDFVYLHYAIGEGPKLQSLFDALLKENGLSRKEFDSFLTKNKHKYIDLNKSKNYVELRKRKDIIDRMLAAVRTSSKEKRTELLAKVGWRNSDYDYYVYAVGDLSSPSLTGMQIAIGADTKLNSIFAELLLEQGSSRQAFEQAIADVIAVYSTVWHMHYPEQEITRELALEILSTEDNLFYNGREYFAALISGDKNVFPPAKVERISSIFREMFAEKTSAQKNVDYRLTELGIRGLFSSYVTKKPSLDELSYVKYMLGEEQQELFNALLAEYDLNKKELAALQTQYNNNRYIIDSRKDIIDRMLAAVRTSPEQEREELLTKIGLDEEQQLAFVNLPYGVKIKTLGKIQLAIGDDAKLNTLFDELLDRQRMSRRVFEQAISDTAVVYDILFDRITPKRETPPRQLVLENMHQAWLGFTPPHLARIKKDASPFRPETIKIVSVLREMLENVRTSDEQATTQLMKKIGLTDDALELLVKESSVYRDSNLLYHKKIALAGYFADMQRAIGNDTELNAQLDQLMALLQVSRQEMALENIVASSETN